MDHAHSRSRTVTQFHNFATRAIFQRIRYRVLSFDICNTRAIWLLRQVPPCSKIDVRLDSATGQGQPVVRIVDKSAKAEDNWDRCQVGRFHETEKLQNWGLVCFHPVRLLNTANVDRGGLGPIIVPGKCLCMGPNVNYHDFSPSCLLFLHCATFQPLLPKPKPFD